MEEANPSMPTPIETSEVIEVRFTEFCKVKDLMEESSLQSSLDILEKDCDDSIRDNGGALNTPPGSKRKFDLISSPTKTITKTEWLQIVVSPLPSNPSAQLERFLASCDKDVTSDVIRRAQIILEAIFPSGAEQRRSEALKLYYRVLEAMCVAEAQILHASNLTSLLTNERFHRCMLACSAESVVVATSRTSSTMLFPAVFEITGITAFDLSKVIESFIRHEESLPRELRRHLNSLEERLLESMVWEKGSSMYNSLVIARPALSAEVSRLGLLAEPMPSLDAIALHINFNSGGLLPPVPALQKHEASPGLSSHQIDIRSPKRPSSVLVDRNSFGSPMKDHLLGNLKSKLPPLPLQSAFASPARPNPGRGGETCAEAGINVFFGKINKLAAVRINGMIETLQKSQQHIREDVYRLFQQILTQQTPLFFNRHIDQIMLCCIFGVAKKLEVDLTFEKINDKYGNQPQCRRGFRNVFVDRSFERLKGRTGHDHLHIIPFYNQIFLPAVRHLLKEVGSAGTTMKAQEGMIFGSLPDMSPKKVSAARNVYVSPLRTSKMDALISNGGRSYYACVGESTQPYRSPSKDLTDINDRLNVRNRKKMKGALNLDNDVGLVSDSMVADSLFYHNGCCASSSSGVPPLKSEQPDTTSDGHFPDENRIG